VTSPAVREPIPLTELPVHGRPWRLLLGTIRAFLEDDGFTWEARDRRHARLPRGTRPRSSAISVPVRRRRRSRPVLPVTQRRVVPVRALHGGLTGQL